MGNTNKKLDNVTRDPRGLTTLKLEAQKIKEFSGAPEDWQKWKSRTECALRGTGYENILSDSIYAFRHPRMNMVVYSQISAATVDGIAYHLVRRFEPTTDGNAAWVNPCDWYDWDTVQNETAENLRVK